MASSRKKYQKPRKSTSTFGASSTMGIMTIIGSTNCYSLAGMDLQTLAIGIWLILRSSDVRFECMRGLYRAEVVWDWWKNGQAKWRSGVNYG